MDISLVLQELKGLSAWLKDSEPNREIVDKIVEELERGEPDAHRAEQLKLMLSTKMLFHPKWLGDVCVSGFVGDGTACAWMNYLSHIADVCQNNL